MYKRNKIIVNCRFLTQNLTGVQRFAIEISKQLRNVMGDQILIVSPKKIMHYDIANELKVQVIGFNSGHLWEQIDLPLYLNSNHSNSLLLNLANTGPLFYSNKIITLHDIAYERFSSSFSWRFSSFYKIIVPRLLNNCKHIFTVSNFSKEEISLFYNIPKDNISVVYNAVSDIFKLSKKNNNQKYILAVSSITPHKNFNNLIKAYNILKGDSVKLVLVGSSGMSFNNVEIDKKDNKNIIFKGRVSDNELTDLYTNAICFIHPSLYEGFGIPPLEAQSCGTPVISSNAASLPEIGMDSFLYFDPNNIDDIAEKIELLIHNKALQKELTAKGFKNIKRFSWITSARKIQEII